MPIDETDSTFEYAANWLVSSETFMRDAMWADAVDLDTARSQAKARIYSEEALQDPNEDQAGDSAPDLPPPVNSRPLAVVITESDERRRVGTGTWSGRGELTIVVEVPVPEQYLALRGSQTPAEIAARFTNRKQWARRLCRTIRDELRATSGRDDGAGNPYLNATDVHIKTPPSDPETQEDQDYIGWEYAVPWVG